MKILLAYVPVLHRGYVEFFERHADADYLVIFGSTIIGHFDWLARKDIRALDPELIGNLVRSMRIFRDVRILDESLAEEIANAGAQLVFADESESRDVARQYFGGMNVVFDRVFLRWDKSRVTKEEKVEAASVSQSEMAKLALRSTEISAMRSPDWWRQVGAILSVRETVIAAYNNHHPSEHITYALGDPRSFFKKGVAVELTCAFHAEAAVIAEAARRGISTIDGVLYVNTFPCPFCSILIAHSGLQSLYFSSGYSMLDGENLLRNAGIKLFHVND